MVNNGVSDKQIRDEQERQIAFRMYLAGYMLRVQDEQKQLEVLQCKEEFQEYIEEAFDEEYEGHC